MLRKLREGRQGTSVKKTESATIIGKGGKEKKVRVSRTAPTPAPIGKIVKGPTMPKKLKPSKPMRPRKGKPVNSPLRTLGKGIARMVK